MVLTEILDFLGVPGSILLVISVLITIYHGKHILAFIGRMTMWFRIVAAVALLVALAIAGFIPGVDLSVHLHTLLDALAGVVTWLWSVARGFL